MFNVANGHCDPLARQSIHFTILFDHSGGILVLPPGQMSAGLHQTRQDIDHSRFAFGMVLQARHVASWFVSGQSRRLIDVDANPNHDPAGPFRNRLDQNSRHLRIRQQNIVWPFQSDVSGRPYPLLNRVGDANARKH